MKFRLNPKYRLCRILLMKLAAFVIVVSIYKKFYCILNNDIQKEDLFLNKIIIKSPSQNNELFHQNLHENIILSDFF